MENQTNQEQMIAEQKEQFAKIIKQQMKNRNLTVRGVAELIENFSFPQLTRITGGKNYNIDTLIKVLDVLGLELNVTLKDIDSKDSK